MDTPGCLAEFTGLWLVITSGSYHRLETLLGMLPKQGLFLGDRQALLVVEMAGTLVKGGG